MNTNTAAVGLLVPPMWFRDDHAERHALLSRIAAAGIDHLAVGDHVSFITGAGFDGLTHATALLASQRTLPVHLAVYLLALRHPVPTARTLATIAELAPGRLTLGVGVGGEDPHELEICGVDPGTRGARLDEALHLVRRLLTGESISHAGRHFSVRDATIVPPPVPPVPVLVGGRSDAALARAGRLGDGWLGIWVSPRRFAEAVARTAEAAAAAGRPRPVAHELNVWCGIDRDAGAARARLAAAMEGLYATPFERFERYSPAGSPEQVAEFLAGYVDAGCQSFNLIVADDEPARVVDAAVEVRTARRVRAAAGRASAGPGAALPRRPRHPLRRRPTARPRPVQRRARRIRRRFPHAAPRPRRCHRGSHPGVRRQLRASGTTGPSPSVRT